MNKFIQDRTYRPFWDFRDHYVIATCCNYGRICLSREQLAQAAVASETDRPADLKEVSNSYWIHFFKLKVMVTSCGVVGCAKNRSNAPKEGFFHLPSIDKYRWNFTKIVSTEARYMVIKNQSQRFNPISACRKEFNTARLWKSFYFGQTSGSVWTIQPRLGSKFKSWIQKIISYFFTRVSLWTKCKEEKTKWK